MNLKPGKGQKTLTDSFKAGQLIKEAKTRRREALLGKDTIEVNSKLLIGSDLIWVRQGKHLIFFWGKNFRVLWGEPVFQGRQSRSQGSNLEVFLFRLFGFLFVTRKSGLGLDYSQAYFLK